VSLNLPASQPLYEAYFINRALEHYLELRSTREVSSGSLAVAECPFTEFSDTAPQSTDIGIA